MRSHFRPISTQRPLAHFMSALSIVGVLGLAATGCHSTANAQGLPAISSSTASVVRPSATSLDAASLVEKVKATVVNITVEPARLKTASPDNDEHDDEGSTSNDMFPPGVGELFRHHGIPTIPGIPEGGGAPRRQQRALGSGFIFDDKGHVLTNAHVVEGAETVKIKLSDERELHAKVVGRDSRLDVALLAIEGGSGSGASAKSATPPPPLSFATLGSSGALRVGEPVVAIGNPFGLGHTVTTGIVSAKGRAIGAGPYDDFIQTDASINPGNSGGPLFDTRGNVVGMNTAINPAGQGIGFAIPVDAIKEIVPQLLETGHVSRARLGVHIQEIDASLAEALGLRDTSGALVGDIEKGGPADKVGLASGDVITRVDQTSIKHARDLSRAIARHTPGSKVKLEVRRRATGELTSLDVTLGNLDDDDGDGRGRSKKSSSSSSKDDGTSRSTASSLGLSVEDAQQQGEAGRGGGGGGAGGAIVRRVAPNSPALGTLLPGDIIIELDKKPVASVDDLRSHVNAAPPDKPLLARIKRGDNTRYVVIDRANANK